MSDATLLGSRLFVRLVSGARVVPRGKVETVGGVPFEGFGAHVRDYPHAYLTAAAALGASHADVDLFIERLETELAKMRRGTKAGQKLG